MNSTITELGKTCDSECRFVEEGPSLSTDVYYPPVYDKHGVNVNPDGNITSGTIRCTVCNKSWAYSSQYGKTEYKQQS